MISYIDLTLENWYLWRAEVLNSESVFQESIRGIEEEFTKILNTHNHIFKIIKFNEEYIGNIIGCDAHNIPTSNLYGCLKDKSFLQENSIHLGNIIIDPLYQGKGYGTGLLKEFIAEAKDRGYTKLIGFFRPNNSLPLIKKVGGIEKSIHKNWFNTGEDYIFCELNLE